MTERASLTKMKTTEIWGRSEAWVICLHLRETRLWSAVSVGRACSAASHSDTQWKSNKAVGEAPDSVITSVRSHGLQCSEPQPAVSMLKVREWRPCQVVAQWWAGPSPEPNAIDNNCRGCAVGGCGSSVHSEPCTLSVVRKVEPG